MSLNREDILRDYRIGIQSREASLIGRREVLTGKAKFGIFGDGKEVAQLAMARAFRKGDFRSGYYRDQTFMFAAGMSTIEEFFAQLYAHADVEADPASAGRSMTAHFATRMLDADGEWLPQTEMRNSAADVSPTGSQMPRLVGLAYASRLYREMEELAPFTEFSHSGNEVAFGTIGNASCAEGMFWEAINAAAVLKVPMLVSIWDDGYGISVPNHFQMAKNLTDLLGGFRRGPEDERGFDLYTVRAWDYPALCETYLNAAEVVRMGHVPAILHIIEATQPQGHSTSGSHERYKSEERLAWERDHDCLKRMRAWVLEQDLAGAEELDEMEEEDRKLVRELKDRAWEHFLTPLVEERRSVVEMVLEISAAAAHKGHEAEIEEVAKRLRRVQIPQRRETRVAAHKVLRLTHEEDSPERRRLLAWKRRREPEDAERYSSHLYSESADSPLEVEEVPAAFSQGSATVNGFEVLNACFDAMLERDPRIIAFGEDVGQLGDVNQGFAGLQEKYGELRVTDTGIRECTILGQAIGMAMRGLRPIAEVQYLDYVLYALQIMSDDLATLQYRTKGGQKAPVIVRTRGHRLEGIWHAGSPMAGILNLVRGLWVCVPRNMTQAAGFYNTLLAGDDPGLVVEVLNGYRVKERLPDNIGEMKVPLGVPEVLREGDDVTLVTYGACCRIAQEAAEMLAAVGIEVEVIDVQTLLPFDRPGIILDSLKKTNRVVFVDEDVPGGATAYMLREVVERQGGYHWLDSEPRTVSAKAHRPAYGSDGDYFSKPNAEEIFEAVHALLHESDPGAYPIFYR